MVGVDGFERAVLGLEAHAPALEKLYKRLDGRGAFSPDAASAGRPSFSSRRERAFWSRARVSPACTGSRMVRPVFAMPRVIA